jgi:hypothetical protein
MKLFAQMFSEPKSITPTFKRLIGGGLPSVIWQSFYFSVWFDEGLIIGLPGLH